MRWLNDLLSEWNHYIELFHLVQCQDCHNCDCFRYAYPSEVIWVNLDVLIKIYSVIMPPGGCHIFCTSISMLLPLLAQSSIVQDEYSCVKLEVSKEDILMLLWYDRNLPLANSINWQIPTCITEFSHTCMHKVGLSNWQIPTCNTEFSHTCMHKVGLNNWFCLSFCRSIQ